MKEIKQSKGITMITLIITIIVILIISGVTIYESVENIKARKIDSLYADLELLEDKVNTYYLNNGTIPIKEEFKGSENFKTVRNVNDNDVYYVIDISSLDGVSLNMKLDFTGDDVYIMNEQTHTVYYPKGLTIDNETYYTLPKQYSKIEDTDNNKYYKVTVVHKFAEGEESDSISLPKDYILGTFLSGETFEISAEKVDGYALMSQTIKGTVLDYDMIVTLTYYKDEISENYIYNPDGIPDICQAIVSYVSNDMTKGIIVGNTEEVVTLRDEKGNISKNGEAVIDASISVEPLNQYAFDKWSTSDGREFKSENLYSIKVTGNTVFTANFDKDTYGGGDYYDAPDGVPDKYQAVVTYTTENPDMGIITGNVYELIYSENGTFKIKANVTVEPIGRYVFDSWTIDGGEVFQTLEGIEVNSGFTTFTAHFARRNN